MAESVTLVIAVRNEAPTVEALLRSIAVQTRAPDECIVIDDGSQDGTADRVEELRNAGVVDLRLRRLPPSGTRERTVSRARNIAIGDATGSIIALADAGNVLAPDWLEKLMRPFEEDPGTAICGGFSRPGGHTWFQRCLATVITTQIEEVDPDRFLPVGRSMAFRREWWERLGGFPEWVGNCEDLMFDLRVRDAGGRFGFAPEAICIWYPSRTLRGFFSKYLSYARGDGRAGLWTRRHLIRYGSYAAGIAILALAWRQPLAWVALALGFGAYAWKFHRRLTRVPPGDGPWSALASRALLPVILVTGDAAKMVGYPLGLIQSLRLRPQGLGQ